MKKSVRSRALLLFLFFLLSSSTFSARLLTTEQGQNVRLEKVTGEEFGFEMEGSESMNELMGIEDCNDGDKECLKRRMTIEAHLDYIYTQNHKP
ncbi:hypothetical protein L6164_018996 [Bauhinia variegata]|uniref:Uncharacterized protein n=1 Tax=Bauhinia variegata TaxID=167791 RepID=A0ACB9NE78_BAUVA|nr:hypothetical protein L6164_018996 [Bauhinia variegata]